MSRVAADIVANVSANATANAVGEAIGSLCACETLAAVTAYVGATTMAVLVPAVGLVGAQLLVHRSERKEAAKFDAHCDDVRKLLADLAARVEGSDAKLADLVEHRAWVHARLSGGDQAALAHRVVDTLKRRLTELGLATDERLEGLRVYGETILGKLDDVQTALSTQMAEMEKRLLARLTAAAPPQAAGDASIQSDLVAAVERIARDAARGGMTARGVLDSDRPADAAIYLAARREQLDRAQHALNERVGAEKLNLDRELAAVAYVTGRIYDAQAALGRLLAADPDDLDAITRLGHIYDLRGDLDAAERQYRRLLDLDASDATRAVALGNLGILAFTRGDLDTAERFHTEALYLARRLGSLEMQASDLGNLGVVAQTRGDLDTAERFYAEALAIERRLGHLEGQASDLGNLGNVAQMRGDLDAAERFHTEALTIERRLGHMEGQASTLGNLGNVAQTRGDLNAAERFYAESLDIARRLGSSEIQAICLGNVGLIAQRRGDHDAAMRFHTEALDLARQLGGLEGQASELGNLGAVAKQRCDVAEARRLWTESRDLFARIGMPHMVEQLQGWLDGLPPE